MTEQRKLGVWGLLVVLIGLLVLAWLDGGREEQRMIVQPVELPMEQTEQGA
jgi:hypothetical protein